jgi:hypothetical protein
MMITATGALATSESQSPDPPGGAWVVARGVTLQPLILLSAP